MHALILFLLLFFLSSCNTKNCETNKPECIQEKMKKLPVQKLSYWQNSLKLPVYKRVFSAPNELIDYIRLDNQLNGFSEKPQTIKASKKLQLEIEEAIKELPQKVKDLVAPKFLGVYLIQGLGGTGYTESVFNTQGEAVAAFIALDAGILTQRKANEWATWKESSVFQSDGDYQIELIIEEPERNKTKYAIQYLVLHELAHVYSVGEKIHPLWNDPIESIQNESQFSFFTESWKINSARDKIYSIFDQDKFPQRSRVRYYTGAKLKNDEMIEVFENLQKTNFVSLYASTHYTEDWAESFATYVHKILMKKPYRFQIKKLDKLVKTYELCWGQKRCQAKEKYLQKIFQ